MEKGIQRWVVDISQWNPSQDEFTFIVSILPLHEHSSIMRFVKFEDRKRALVSRLLQYALVYKVLGIPFDEIVIKRTADGKPYLESDNENIEFPNFNFNASHQGDYVAIASEPICIVGLDIVSHVIPKQESIHEYIGNFSSYFSKFEWDNMMNVGPSDDILGEFYRYWCLKEAYVKAIGAGLGFRLDKLEFHHTNWTNISAYIDGEKLRDWRFWIFELEKRHWVSIARGHPSAAISNYKRTLKQTQFMEEEYQSVLQLPNPGFMRRTVEELIPVSYRAGTGVFQISEDQERGDVSSSI